MALRPSATVQEADTARKYDFTIVEVEMGVDLFALALLIATLRDWLAICHRSVPVVCKPLVIAHAVPVRVEDTWRPGVSMPAVTMRLEMTKHDIRNGRNTGSPVSA